MSSQKMNISNYNFKDILAIGPVKQTSPNSAKTVNVYFKTAEGQVPILVQTAYLRSFGINKWPTEPSPDDLTPPKLSVTYSFDGQDELRTFFERMDEWAIDHVHANSWDYLKTKSAPRDTIAFNYTRCVKVPLDKTTGEPNGKPATMKVKLSRDEAVKADSKTGQREYSASFFNTDKQAILPDDVDAFFTMGSRVRVLIQCTGFWIAAGKFGLTWRLKQAIIDPPSRIGKEYAFDDDEDDAEAAAAADEPPAKKARAQESPSHYYQPSPKAPVAAESMDQGPDADGDAADAAVAQAAVAVEAAEESAPIAPAVVPKKVVVRKTAAAK
jgi:hypothetical protein